VYDFQEKWIGGPKATSPILLVVEGCERTPRHAGSWNKMMSTHPAYLSSTVETVSQLFRALKERIEIDLNECGAGFRSPLEVSWGCSIIQKSC
jgi:hypothetical protein